MRLADLMGARVLDATGRDIGHVGDIRFVETSGPAGEPTRLRIEGLVIAPRRSSRMLAYDHRPVTAPWPLTTLARRATRHALWASWKNVASRQPPSTLGEPGTITLRQNASDLSLLSDMHAHWNK
ncbi:hypothetical protein J7E97_14890 [Streptomyces sp. ISL-66]|uniref:PRC-barrel domain-containing protein n=1 Tax=Streptomyces sp. ISL-66 TaxID=2819186 RepID=UPI001BE94FEE|nr:hypothetical protein [Streptomyces sp. ISL-66]MBT2469122.1 hypothetical protein [Streptomyces sp. ISL-66]